MDGPFFNFANFFRLDISYLESEFFFLQILIFDQKHIFFVIKLVICSIKLGKYHESNVVSVADNTC